MIRYDENFIDIESSNDKRPRINRSNLAAYCGSPLCNPGTRLSTSSDVFTHKLVNKGVFWCPDCSNALYWTYEPQRKKPIKVMTGAGFEPAVP